MRCTCALALVGLFPLSALAQPAPSAPPPGETVPAEGAVPSAVPPAASAVPPAASAVPPAASAVPPPATGVPSAGQPAAPAPYVYIPPIQGMPTLGAQPPAEKVREDLSIYRHDGFFARVSLGFGPGRATLRPTLVPPGSLLSEFGSGTIKGLASTGELLLGGTPTPGFVVGSGFMFWGINKRASHSVNLGVVPLFVNYYLDAEGPWFVQAFAGLATGSLSDKSDRTSDAGGLALGAGGGWEGWVGEQGSLGVAFRLTYASVTRDTVDERYSLRFLLPTLSGNFTFH
ncbi:MAG: hypothetical protein SFV15_08365 [Polyangiaceae bacterium]|nr:hypothetical protein [Polyangiaceae bacterium]